MNSVSYCTVHQTKFASIYNLNIYIATIYLIPIFSLIYLQNSNPQFIQTQVAYIQNSSTPGPTVMFTQQLNCSHPSSISKPQIQILIAPNAQNPLTTSQAWLSGHTLQGYRICSPIELSPRGLYTLH